ncbi:MAG: dipeptide ABC transporter ATP-binding protein [Gemmobacter sp.]|nr:dipeptide ABC transporter ATP-binding protein [Gemmobacter sp.]
MTLLSVENLSLSIHGTPILRDVSFRMREGEVFGLVGESGSGKSLTAFSLMQLLPDGSRLSGRAVLNGVDLLGLSESQMCAVRGRDVGMIFQEPMTALNPVQCIGDQVAEALIVHGAANRADAARVAREKLNRVGLTQDRFPLSRFPHELSGGQRQRVCIAMAVALRPKLLIADEPTTALDVTTQAQILELLKDLVAEERMGLLLITHDLAVVAGMADHVAVMQSGQIVEQGETGPLFQARAHDYTRTLFAASAHQPNRTALVTEAPLLQVRDLRRSYALPRRTLLGPVPRVDAVKGVSFTLRQGESLGLVGESGCGKSTLTRAVLGLEPVQGGTITLDGDKVEPGAMTPALRSKMQVVFQDPYGSFNPRHKVARLVSEPFHLAPAPAAEQRDRIAAALTEVGMAPSDMEKYIHEFSGGQRQRIAIARALIVRPKLIVLDEAVSALDVRVRAQILDLLAALQASHGLSYLFISHDLHVVRAITDRVMVMQAGQIVEQGETESVFTAPQHAYTRQLIAATPRLDTALAARSA